MWKANSNRPVKKPVSSAVTARQGGMALEGLEDRRLLSTYSFTVSVNAYAAGITSGHDTGTGSLAATVVSLDLAAPPSNETILRAALTQAGVTLSARHTATLNGTYSGSGPSASGRLQFLAAENTGANYPGTTSHEASLADAKGLAGNYVVAFEDGTDFDFNDGYFLVNIAAT